LGVAEHSGVSETGAMVVVVVVVVGAVSASIAALKAWIKLAQGS